MIWQEWEGTPAIADTMPVLFLPYLPVVRHLEYMVRGLWLMSCLLMFVVSCTRSSEQSVAETHVSNTNLQVFEVKGQVKSVKPSQKQVEIKHEAIPGYMPAMTMPFDVKDTNELTGLQPGEPISFRLSVTDTEGWIDNIRSLGPATNIAATKIAPMPVEVQRVPDVEPLEPGDPLPQYYFTNQFDLPITTTQFKGQALAITFLFTRCPFPTFCPKMANQFGEAQQKLLSLSGGPTNWHLLTISFDPEFDKPSILKNYAESHHYIPEHWTFATGDLTAITAIGEQFGLQFWHDQTGSITHNLRTVVIDHDGRIQKIFKGGDWTSAELCAELVRAAGNQTVKR